MSIETAMRISVTGMNRQVDSLDKTALNVARGTTVERQTYDPGDDMIDLNMGEHNFKANFRVFQVADETMAQIINLKR
ncbi:hypothetical protein [Bartonella choladocola]|uniref:Uncharacterized protein n=1 Tax=Bartonella choladocola TaxID=2750995 RepID=A0A1U9MGV4_9HYPH|nr:hypothetical protein [Bartonella choladocola]AQT46871.1 hypothetical protein BBC0122_007430 [Bartonella choladocola]